MKHILVQGTVVWQALQNETSTDFDVLWDVLQSPSVQGYITPDDLDALHRWIAEERSYELADELVAQVQDVLIVCPPEEPMDAAIANGVAASDSALEDASTPVPLLSVTSFLERHALEHLYDTDRPSVELGQWYRKRSSRFDPFLFLPIVLTATFQNLPFFQRLFADVLDGVEFSSLRESWLHRPNSSDDSVLSPMVKGPHPADDDSSATLPPQSSDPEISLGGLVELVEQTDADRRAIAQLSGDATHPTSLPGKLPSDSFGTIVLNFVQPPSSLPSELVVADADELHFQGLPPQASVVPEPKTESAKPASRGASKSPSHQPTADVSAAASLSRPVDTVLQHRVSDPALDRTVDRPSSGLDGLPTFEFAPDVGDSVIGVDDGVGIFTGEEDGAGLTDGTTPVDPSMGNGTDGTGGVDAVTDGVGAPVDPSVDAPPDSFAGLLVVNTVPSSGIPSDTPPLSSDIPARVVICRADERGTGLPHPGETNPGQAIAADALLGYGGAGLGMDSSTDGLIQHNTDSLDGYSTLDSISSSMPSPTPYLSAQGNLQDATIPVVQGLMHDSSSTVLDSLSSSAPFTDQCSPLPDQPLLSTDGGLPMI